MRVIDKTYFNAYKIQIKNVANKLATFLSTSIKQELEYQLNVSAVYSSNIEGNSLDMNSYMNSITKEISFTKKRNEVEEIKDLANTYNFAQKNELNSFNFLKTHALLSQTFLIKDKRGVYRTDRMGVFDNTGMVYLALEAEKITNKMNLIFNNIKQLLGANLTVGQAFYHASLIHLKLAHIHPFWDGNGRSARLLEKWFLSKIIDSELWKLPSEKFHKTDRESYYNHIALGIDYYSLDYKKCLPFLVMLPKSLQVQSND